MFSFVESAPKDSFRILNSGSCATGPVDVIIDLSPSAGKLVFDTTDAGAGVEVYQPFQLIAGADRVVAATPVTDGDDMVHLNLSGLAPGEDVVFTIDVDDQLDASELGRIRVTGSEIQGATATVIGKDRGAVSGVYGPKGQAVARYEGCL